MPKDLRIYLDAWPVGRKLVIERDVVVIFTYPHPAVFWDQTASLYHAASMSRVDLNSDGKLAIARYENNEGRQALERILTNESSMEQIRGLIPWKIHRRRNRVGGGDCLPIPNGPANREEEEESMRLLLTIQATQEARLHHLQNNKYFPS